MTDIHKSCWFLLYPPTSLKVSLKSKSVLVPYIVYFKYNIMSSGNRNNLIASFLSHIPFISFSCLVLDKNLSTKLDKQERPGALVSSWSLEEMFSDFYHLVKIFGSMFVKIQPLLCWAIVLLSPASPSFYYEGTLHFSKCILCVCWDAQVISVSLPIYVDP